jgi:hypothetical protein
MVKGVSRPAESCAAAFSPATPALSGSVEQLRRTAVQETIPNRYACRCRSGREQFSRCRAGRKHFSGFCGRRWRSNPSGNRKSKSGRHGVQSVPACGGHVRRWRWLFANKLPISLFSTFRDLYPKPGPESGCGLLKHCNFPRERAPRDRLEPFLFRPFKPALVREVASLDTTPRVCVCHIIQVCHLYIKKYMYKKVEFICMKR